MSKAPSRAPSRAPSAAPNDLPTSIPPSSSSSSSFSSYAPGGPSRVPSSSTPSRAAPGGSVAWTKPFAGKPSSTLAPVPEGSAVRGGPKKDNDLPTIGGAGGGSVLKSVYQSPEDVRRASLQSRYGSLSAAERKKQDAWAMKKADHFAPCPASFAWRRTEEGHGYRCEGGAHYISDATLAEGVPSLYVLANKHRDLDNCSREPPEHEHVPDGFRGPVRPVGMDARGAFTYLYDHVDPAQSRKAMDDWGYVLGWKPERFASRK
ncbi:hypothetical protein F4780DRAFT_775807 [Xylariomycetidae sp. FL0641]|nr:hypothetical protein F4780DRAFT_775807 [Xylariomycetidae sp. FL0641]